MRNPYKIEGPALISFSGGRTSGYMLHRILEAHDGKLPEDVFVVFANTGKEAEQTLEFVDKCSREWNVKVQPVELAIWRHVRVRNMEPRVKCENSVLENIFHKTHFKEFLSICSKVHFLHLIQL